VKVPAAVPRILYLHPGPTPPSVESARNAVAHWRPWVSGVLLMPSWLKQDDVTGLERIRREGMNGFEFESLPTTDTRFAQKITRFVETGQRLAAEGPPFDLVMSYGGMATGLAAWRLSRSLGIPLVLQFPGHPYRGILHAQGRFRHPRALVAKWVNRFLVTQAAHVRLLYATQLNELGLRRMPRRTIGHDFTPVSLLGHESTSPTQDILLMGYPWHLKGVDLLIKAFLQIADTHPDVKLRVIGHCPDRTPFEQLAGGHPRISLEKAVHSVEAQAAISGCLIFVSASRTEGTARVLLEAGAAGRPVVASNVDGTPYLIRDGVNGLLFESENVADLAAKLDRVLFDAALRRTLGENGRRIVMEKYSEAAYARSMVTMFYQVLGRTPPEDLPGAPPV